MYCGVVSQFCMQQVFNAIVLIIVAECPEIVLYCLVLMLCLSIPQWIEGC